MFSLSMFWCIRVAIPVYYGYAELHECNYHICMCVYVCKCIYVFVYVCVWVYVSVSVCVYVCMYEYVCVYLCVCICVCERMCGLCVYMFTCVYACVLVCMCAYTHTHKHTYTHYVIYCNMAARGLTDIYAWSLGRTVPEGECRYISKTLSTSVLQHLCNTFNSRVLHCS